MSRRRALVAVVATALLASGCVQMPDSGPIHDVASGGSGSAEEAPAIDAAPPPAQAPPADIVTGFMGAMAGWPIQVGVARQYLSKEAAAAWNPTQATMTYVGKLPPDINGNSATIELSGVERLDEFGAWEGEAPESQQELHFSLTLENGEFRITNPPNALIVPADWFAQRFTQMSLYFFDQTGSILVPEPVFVPRGDQLASTLVSRLLQPSDDLRGVSRSFLPAGDPPLSVPVTDEGVAEIDLGEVGTVPKPDDPTLSRMLAQLGWTLRQVPGIRALRLSFGGQVVRPPGNDAVYTVTEGGRYDPTYAKASQQLYALQNGRLVYGEPDELTPAVGPLGAEGDHGLRSIAVSLDGSDVVGVTSDGTGLVTAPVHASDTDPRPLLSGAADLLPPAWDFADRLWLVDNAPSGARVSYLEGRRPVSIRVPGVSGHRVRSFLVSRDGTRFVAVVADQGRGDQIRVGRVRHDGQGRVAAVARTRPIPVKDVQRSRIVDVAWTSPTSILVARAGAGQSSEVSTVPVDGAPSESLSTPVGGRVLGLAASPDGTSTPFAVTPEGLVDLDTGTVTPFFGGPLRSATYVG